MGRAGGRLLLFFSAFVLLGGGLLVPLAHAQGSAAPLRPRASLLSPPPGSGPGAGATGPRAFFDEQLGTTFAQDVQQVEYEVTATPQVDSDGYGPAYFVDGLSGAGYWYQAGITYDWLYTSGGYSPGWNFIYEVWDAQGQSVFPVACCSGLAAFPSQVRAGDEVQLRLYFSGGDVVMYARDLGTGAAVQVSYPADGASSFQGLPQSTFDPNGYFTGLMTEWYHASPYEGAEAVVRFTDGSSALGSAWMWMDEWEPSDPAWTGAWYASTQAPVSYSADPGALRPLAAVGAMEASDASEFVTGTAGTAPTTIRLEPDGFSHPLSPGNQFSVSYVLDGQNDTAYSSGGTLTVLSDAGTALEVSGLSNGSSSTERWALDASGSPVVLTAGTTVTLYYYDLLLQTPSYAVLGGGPRVGPTLRYYTAPLAPSGKGLVLAALELSASEQQVWAVRGTPASVSVQLAAGAGEAWSTQTSRWTIDSPEQIPSPIVYYGVFPMAEAGA